jgi:hypothetical protein
MGRLRWTAFRLSTCCFAIHVVTPAPRSPPWATGCAAQALHEHVPGSCHTRQAHSRSAGFSEKPYPGSDGTRHGSDALNPSLDSRHASRGYLKDNDADTGPSNQTEHHGEDRNT